MDVSATLAQVDDPEFKALAAVVLAMQAAPADARARILAYVLARFEIDAGEL